MREQDNKVSLRDITAFELAGRLWESAKLPPALLTGGIYVSHQPLNNCKLLESRTEAHNETQDY